MFERHSMGWALVSGLGAGALLVGVFYGTSKLMDLAFDTGKRGALCDRYVDTLLHSDSLVEVTRSAFLVRYLDCSVSTRAQ